MREIFTDKNFIETKKILAVKIILIIALFVFFIPLFILPFFNHACTDDYICGYDLRQKDFLDYQVYIYNEKGGRFAATFIGSLFAKNNYLYDHYYLHSLLLLLVNFLSAWFLLSVLNKYVLKNDFIKRNVLLFSFIYIALNICCLPEPSTFLSWFSSAITYQTPVILVQIEIALFILLLNSSNAISKSVCSILLIILFFIINGFNELFIVVQLLMLIALFFFKAWRNISPAFLIFISLAFAGSAAIVLLSPGNEVRASVIVPKGLAIGTVAVLYHVAETLWSIFKEPLFWFSAMLVFMFANNTKGRYNEMAFIKKLANKKWIMPITIILFLIAAISLPVFALKGGIIPDRYLNSLVCVLIILLMIYAFVLGVETVRIQLPLILKKSVVLAACIFFLVGLLCNTFIKDAYKSIVSAPLYNAIITERENILKTAASTNKIAVVKSYDTTLKEHLNKEYSNSAQTLYNLVQQKPSLIFFYDDLATDYSIGTLKSFYGLDSIIIK